MMPPTTQEIIDELTARPRVDKGAVERFLSDLNPRLRYTDHIRRLRHDARLYHYNQPTFEAILDGIEMVDLPPAHLVSRRPQGS